MFGFPVCQTLHLVASPRGTCGPLRSAQNGEVPMPATMNAAGGFSLRNPLRNNLNLNLISNRRIFCIRKLCNKEKRSLRFNEPDKGWQPPRLVDAIKLIYFSNFSAIVESPNRMLITTESFSPKNLIGKVLFLV